MEADWKTLRAELPKEIRARLDAKREERQLGKAQAEHSGASSPKPSSKPAP
ncbi:hypothetical protein [Rhizobium sp. FY34]|uniref:hypothetical protein n=1 Tax=Rhizobium sp. FY34 TaxID=2562309 RepID=UPI00198041A5|nr:hypothetical protein [Rhizobium sp. FY34]